MSFKTLIWIGVLVGSTVGGAVPLLWGASFFSISSILGNTLGGLVGVYVAYKVSKM